MDSRIGTGKSIFFILLASLVLLGFRTFPNGNNWMLDKTTAATAKIFVTYPYGSRAVLNDLPSSDALSGTATVTIDSLMTSIFSDYNSISASFVTLAGPGDPDYSTNSMNRTISIEEANPNGVFSGGEAKQIHSGNQVTGCVISIRAQNFESATDFVSVVTHEIGHCLGLDHPQEITKSVMSYFQSGDEYRLQADDKMGITYLYPVDAGKAKESATFGMACARRE